MMYMNSCNSYNNPIKWLLATYSDEDAKAQRGQAKLGSRQVDRTEIQSQGLWYQDRPLTSMINCLS